MCASVDMSKAALHKWIAWFIPELVCCFVAFVVEVTPPFVEESFNGRRALDQGTNRTVDLSV